MKKDAGAIVGYEINIHTFLEDAFKMAARFLRIL